MKKTNNSPFLDIDESAGGGSGSKFPESSQEQNQSQKNTPAGPTPQPKKKDLSTGHIPVTIFTGYLGAGKTTVITNLMKSMPRGYKIAWLKNEMGNTAVDTTLVQNLHTATVKEMLQGCICHVMIGQLTDALDELIASEPDRIIIETSGSATPAPVVWNIRNHDRLYVDGVVTVVDAKNFSGYLDKSPSLRMQAKYTDLILINKHEDLDAGTLEKNLDDLYDINLDTPKVKTNHGAVDPAIVFGLDSSLFMSEREVREEEKEADAGHHQHEVDILEIRPTELHDREAMKKALEDFPRTDFYRIKGVLRDSGSYYIVNCSFGECAVTALSADLIEESRIVFMGENLSDHRERVADIFAQDLEDVVFTPREHEHHT